MSDDEEQKKNLSRDDRVRARCIAKGIEPFQITRYRITCACRQIDNCVQCTLCGGAPIQEIYSYINHIEMVCGSCLNLTTDIWSFRSRPGSNQCAKCTDVRCEVCFENCGEIKLHTCQRCLKEFTTGNHGIDVTQCRECTNMCIICDQPHEELNQPIRQPLTRALPGKTRSESATLIIRHLSHHASALMNWRVNTVCPICIPRIHVKFAVETHILPDLASIVADYLTPKKDEVITPEACQHHVDG